MSSKKEATTPVYMAGIPFARENDQLDDFKESRRLNEACAAEISQAIHDSSIEPFHYDMEAAAERLIGQYGLERLTIILANTVQLKASDGRISSDNKAWARGIPLPDVAKNLRFDFYTDVHSTLLDSFINRVRKMERAAEKKPSIHDQLADGKKAANVKNQSKPVPVRDTGREV